MNLIEKLTDKLKNKIHEAIPDKSPKYFQDSNVVLDIVMQDGTIEQYPENLKITDGINCVVCEGFDDYHVHLDCPSFKMQRAHHKMIAMYRKDAERKGIFLCYKCKEWNELDEEWDK